MKIFAIRNADIDKKKDLAYFFFSEKNRECCIEILQNADEWELPFVLDSYARRKHLTLGMSETLRFISQRIVPSDRQNIGMILKDNGLETYDEVSLFLLSEGRCAQDHCFLQKITETELPETIKERYKRRIVSAVPVASDQYLIAFMDGTVISFDLKKQVKVFPFLQRILTYAEKLQDLEIKGLGTEVACNQIGSISSDYLYEEGVKLSYALDDMIRLTNASMVTTQTMTELLGCSRQNINDMVKRGRISPMNTDTREQFFLRTELYKLL